MARRKGSARPQYPEVSRKIYGAHEFLSFDCVEGAVVLNDFDRPDQDPDAEVKRIREWAYCLREIRNKNENAITRVKSREELLAIATVVLHDMGFDYLTLSRLFSRPYRTINNRLTRGRRLRGDGPLRRRRQSPEATAISS